MVAGVEHVHLLLIAMQNDRSHRNGQNLSAWLSRIIALAYMPESIARPRIVDVDFGLHRARLKVQLARKANHLAGKRPPERIHAHLHRIADVHVAHVGFRHRQAQPHHVRLSQLHDRQILIVRTNAGLDQRARVGVAPHDHAIQRRGHIGIVLDRAHPRVVGARDLHALLRRGQRGLGRIHLRRRGKILGLRVIQFLLRHQARLRLRRVQQPLVVRVQRGVCRFGAPHLVLRPNNLVAAARHFRYRAGAAAPSARGLPAPRGSAPAAPGRRCPRKCGGRSRKLWDGRPPPGRAGIVRPASAPGRYRRAAPQPPPPPVDREQLPRWRCDDGRATPERQIAAATTTAEKTIQKRLRISGDTPS